MILGKSLIFSAYLFKKWYVLAKKYVKITTREAKTPRIAVVSSKLAGVCVSFTGYRNKQHEEAILTNGGTVVPFGSKTNILLISASGKLSSKVEKAKQRQVKVTTFDKLKL